MSTGRKLLLLFDPATGGEPPLHLARITEDEIIRITEIDDIRITENASASILEILLLKQLCDLL